MKKLQVIAALGLVASAAQAQSTTSWTGSHAGLTLGRSAYTSSWTDVDGYRNGATLDASRQQLQTAFNLGYDYQAGVTVFGLEYDRTLSAEKVGSAFYSGAVQRTDKLDHLATLRLRAGLAYGNALVYLTGGLGQAEAEHTWTDNSASGAQSWSTFGNKTRGIVTGLGLETRLDTNYAFRLEYLNFHSGTASGTNAKQYTMQVTDSLSTIRIGLSYYF